MGVCGGAGGGAGHNKNTTQIYSGKKGCIYNTAGGRQAELYIHPHFWIERNIREWVNDYKGEQ